MTRRTLTAILAGTLALTAPIAAAAAASDSPKTETVPVQRRVVVSIPDRLLAVLENDRLVAVYPVSVGAPASPSPVGQFAIVSRVTNPTYYRPGVIIGPGARNPIGTRWIGLNQKGYGIHGTDDPKSIGFARSHGCLRLKNADVERLFDRVRTGDIVELHAERTPEIEQLFPAGVASRALPQSDRR